jgi:hypothetical protein
MQFTYTGNNTRFLEQSFFDSSLTLRVTLDVVSPTEAIFTHTIFTQANVNVVLRGVGLSADAAGRF